jgi:transposase-like protein
MGRPSKWSPEFREEAVRLQRESGESITSVAKRLGLSPET